MKKIDSICIIDDDPITIFGIQHQIMNAEICASILVHYNGHDALKSFEDALSHNLPLPRVILLDINMPIMDGWQFLNEFILLKVTQIIDIYIVTSSISTEDKAQSESFHKLTNHNIHYLIKPFNKIQLDLIIDNISAKS